MSEGVSPETFKSLKLLVDMTQEIDHIRSEMMCIDNLAKISPEISDVMDVRKALMGVRDLHDDVIVRLGQVEKLMDKLWNRIQPPPPIPPDPNAPCITSPPKEQKNTRHNPE